MTIGFDGQNAVQNNKHRQDFSRQVIDCVSQYLPDNKYFIYSARFANNAYLTPIVSRTNVKLKHQHKGITVFMWRSVSGILRSLHRHHVKLYHGLCGQVPLRIAGSGIASVVTFEDTQFLTHDTGMGWWERKVKCFMGRKSCHNAQCITTLSQSMKQHLTDAFGLSADAVQVIPPAIGEEYNELTEGVLAETKDKYGFVENKYILVNCDTMDAVDPAMLTAMAQVCDESMDLWLVGKQSKPVAHALRKVQQQCGFKGNIRHSTHTYHNRIAALTAMAHACIAVGGNHTFPSIAAGAQYLGTPVIAGSQFADVLGDGALIVDMANGEQLAKALSLVNDDDARQALTSRAKVNAQQFDGQAVALRYQDVYNQALNS